MTIIVSTGCIYILVTRRWPMRYTLWMTPYRLFFGLLVLLIAGWAFKLVEVVIPKGAAR